MPRKKYNIQLANHNYVICVGELVKMEKSDTFGLVVIWFIRTIKEPTHAKTTLKVPHLSKFTTFYNIKEALSQLQNNVDRHRMIQSSLYNIFL